MNGKDHRLEEGQPCADMAAAEADRVDGVVVVVDLSRGPARGLDQIQLGICQPIFSLRLLASAFVVNVIISWYL